MVRKLDPGKREQFLSTALRLFVARGIQNTSTSLIAAEAGTAAGTLFLYFPTKQDLINELVLKMSREQSDHIRALLDPSLSARETFFRIWDGSLRWFLGNLEAYQYIRQVRDSGMLPEEVVLETTNYLQYYFDAIRKGLEQNAIKPHLSALIGGFLYQDIVAVMELVKSESDPARKNAVIRAGFEIFWDGIKAGPAA